MFKYDIVSVQKEASKYRGLKHFLINSPRDYREELCDRNMIQHFKKALHPKFFIKLVMFEKYIGV